MRCSGSAVRFPAVPGSGCIAVVFGCGSVVIVLPAHGGSKYFVPTSVLPLTRPTRHPVLPAFHTIF